MKKTMVCILVCILMLFSFAGCESTPGSQSSGATQNVKDAASYKIGIVQPMDHLSLNIIHQAIVDELSAMGLSDQIEIVYKNAQGDASNLSAIVNQFIGDQVDAIVPIAMAPAQTAASATKEIPIIFAAVSYPVEAGLVESLDSTDGNITGVSNAIAVPEIFALARELTPQAKTFGFIYNTSEVNSVASIQRAKDYCDANGISYVEALITNTSEVAQAAQSLQGRVDAIFTPNDNTVASAMPTLANEAIRMKLPAYVGADSMVMDGGLATVGIDYTVLGKQVAHMIKRIVIDGESIADNPIEVADDYAKMINTTTAEAIGVTIPESVKETFVMFE